MPISFNFTDNKTGEAKGLNSIDEEMCEYFGIEVDKKNYCGPFLDTRGAGIVASRGTNSGQVTEESFAKYADENKADWNEVMLPFFRKFLIEKYTFRSWR